jgi:uncharacterized protein YacL
MPRRWIRFIRQVGAIIMAVLGYGASDVLWPFLERQIESQGLHPPPDFVQFLLSVSLALFGFAFGYLLAPIFLRPLEFAYEELSQIPPVRLLGATFGLGVGLFLGALAAFPLSLLKDPLGQFLPFAVALTLAYLAAATVGNNPGAFLSLLRNVLVRGGEAGDTVGEYILLDTSVIIDGRVTDVAETGFIEKTLLVPRFVLDELQQIADSSDALRRNRGRRGLEVLERLQSSTRVSVEISDHDFQGVADVDRKLVHVAERLNAAIMTNDYNLNRVAEIQGIRVLNLNELANAVKTMVLPGEQMRIRIIQEGKEPGQGVGYLEDGTMVVVESAAAKEGEMLDVRVTRMLQTVAGRMIFAVIDGL